MTCPVEHLIYLLFNQWRLYSIVAVQTAEHQSCSISRLTSSLVRTWAWSRLKCYNTCQEMRRVKKFDLLVHSPVASLGDFGVAWIAKKIGNSVFLIWKLNFKDKLRKKCVAKSHLQRSLYSRIVHNNIWCINNRTKLSSVLILWLVWFVMHQTLP